MDTGLNLCSAFCIEWKPYYTSKHTLDVGLTDTSEDIELTSTLQSRSLKPQTWFEEQQRAFTTPNHSELSTVQHAVSSAQRFAMSLILGKKRKTNTEERYFVNNKYLGQSRSVLGRRTAVSSLKVGVYVQMWLCYCTYNLVLFGCGQLEHLEKNPSMWLVPHNLHPSNVQ